MTALPRYRTDPSPRALAARLRALRTAGVPVACGVYAGLTAPADTSALHARITYALAQSFVTGTPTPRFEPPPTFQLRLLTAASQGHLDHGTDMTTFPADFTSELWRRVHDRTLTALHPADRRTACDLLLRLGYPQQAASVTGLNTTALRAIDGRANVLSPDWPWNNSPSSATTSRPPPPRHWHYAPPAPPCPPPPAATWHCTCCSATLPAAPTHRPCALPPPSPSKPPPNCRRTR
ncbi:hypothetical protein SAMN05216553_101176 [Lentzea fradiae]|uniref:Uncharacterized protein n=1 Tax=Lentzea fradiae TaxID=200378 RepID=A0A1G7KBA2_9PSEU|nr:hypothetical protein [Lentzea fradiae]SDF34321.1 hypothetical protein SAMN05216553_101176 [Lentzea fradiae]